ncbi:toprim domain-containing protein [Chryseobacterium sp. P1-3]|uniref:toprim domain-containing protein n=1 Tax=Chryseobacterium sp. (strain P1-3) TaxID=1517683 RepID=UPI000AAE47C0|nr:toprim domain-containing protein [Chryseobacterium sp. P1-3]
MNENQLTYNIDDISVIEGNKNELIVFNSSKDRDSFLELLKLNNQNNNRTLVAIHSGANTKKFMNRYQNYEGKIFLCLNGDRTGNMMTLKILTELNNKNIKDIRPLYGISESGNQSLSEYLENKLGLQNKKYYFSRTKKFRRCRP